MTGGELDVTERHSGVERRHDEGSAEHVRVDVAEPGSPSDGTNPAMGGSPVQALARGTAEDRPLRPLAHGQVDHPGGPRHKRDDCGLGALAHDPKSPVTSVEPQILDVGAAGLAHPQTVQAEQDSEGPMGVVEVLRGEEKAPELGAIEPPALGAVALSHGTTRVTRRSTTWSWTGSHWSELLGSGPNWGTGTAQLVFDLATRQLVFVPHPPGPDAYLPNTYVLEGSEWRRQPKPRRLWEMAYDPVTRRLLAESRPGSLWSWTGKRWQLFKRSVVVHGRRGSWSTARDGAFAGQWVTDSAAHEIISFGGDTSLTWLGRTWRAIDARMHSVPVNPQDLTVAYDGAIGGIVAFGGGNGELIGPRTWITGGNSTWELLRSR